MLNVARNIGRFPEIVSAATERRDGFADSLLGEMSQKEIPLIGLSITEITGRTSDGLVIKGLLENEVSRYPFACAAVLNGKNGFSCMGSVLYSEDETILIKCSYRLRSPVSFFDIGSVPVRQELEYRYFTGLPEVSMLNEEEEENEETDDATVYITEEKIVYHRSLSCPSLNLVISSCALNDVGSRRNKGGGKYYPCERCARGRAPQTVFIAKDGDRYHYKRDCSGLKRTITQIALSEAVKTRRACKRCGKQKNGEN